MLNDHDGTCHQLLQSARNPAMNVPQNILDAMLLTKYSSRKELGKRSLLAAAGMLAKV